MSDSSNSRNGPLGLSALIRRYEDSLLQKELRPSTLRTYRSQWAALVEHFGPDHPISEIDASQLSAFLRHRVESGQAAPTTARHDCEAMVRLLRHAASNGLLDGSIPMVDSKRRLSAYGEESFPGADEIGVALDRVAKPRDRDRIVAVYAFMASVRDLGRIRRSDWDDEWLTLRDGHGRERRVPLLDETRAVLERAHAASPGRPFPVTPIEGTIRRFRESCGRRFGASRLMKSLAQDLADEGVPNGHLLSLARGPHVRGAVEPEDSRPIRSAMANVLRRARVVESPIVKVPINPDRSATGDGLKPKLLGRLKTPYSRTSD